MSSKILVVAIIIIILALPISTKNQKISINNKKIKKMEQKADYKKILPFVLKWEGGVSDHDADIGGLTNKGITYITYFSVCEKVYKIKPSTTHFFALSYDEVGLMIEYFWNIATNNNAIKSQKIAESLFNWNWGSGRMGLKWFQIMLNSEYKTNLFPDGIVGNHTSTMINMIDEDELFRLTIKYRYNQFHQICNRNPSQKVFLKGWLNRLRDFAERHGELDFYNDL